MKKQVIRPLFWGIFALLFIGLNACKKDRFTTNGADKLAFSKDTLTFDTVFTARGSTTKYFKIYNRHSEKIRITELRLAGGTGSPFRLNVDGTPTPIASEIEIAAKDSLYVFVEVTIDPNNANSPFVALDSVMMVTNGNTQKVILEAWGQNANYIGSRAGLAYLSCNMGTEVWNDPKPYVIFGWLIIDSCELHIAAGKRIYVHGGIVTKNGIFAPNNPSEGQYNYPYFDGLIIVGKDGRLITEGTKSQPVFFAGDRLEHEPDQTLEAINFSEIPGQWQGIRINSGSVGNRFSYTEIKNSGAGLYVDSAAQVVIQNSIFHNQSGSSLIGVNATIQADNSLFFSGIEHSVQLEYGGIYNFTYCTIAGYSSPDYIAHENPSLRVGNWWCYQSDAVGNCIDARTADLTANFKNCIIYGSLNDEISLSKLDGTVTPFNYSFDHCLIKRKDLDISTGFTNCVFNEDPKFKNVDKLNYHLDSLSKAAGRGTPVSISLDLEDNPRKDPPAAGCYEYQY